MSTECLICKDEGWVCENHPNSAWNEGKGHWVFNIGECGGAGMPCVCNKSDPPWHFKSFEVTDV